MRNRSCLCTSPFYYHHMMAQAQEGKNSLKGVEATLTEKSQVTQRTISITNKSLIGIVSRGPNQSRNMLRYKKALNFPTRYSLPLQMQFTS